MFSVNLLISKWATSIGCSFANFTAPAFYHLIASIYNKKSETKLIIISYTIMLIFAFLFISTNIFTQKTLHEYSWGYYLAVKPTYLIYLAFFFSVFMRCFYLLKKESHATHLPAEKTRNVVLFIAFGIALLGSIDYCSLPKQCPMLFRRQALGH
jgi:hypothetical protein